MTHLDDLANAINPASPNIRAFALEAAAEIDRLNAKVFPPLPPPVTAPIDTSGLSNKTYANLAVTIPPEFSNIDVACIYVHGVSKNIHVGPSVTLVGGYVTLKVYCANNGDIDQLTIDGADISGTGGDIMHFDGSTNVHVDNVKAHGFINQGAEHHDGVQIQSGGPYYFGPGVEIDQTLAFPNNGFFINEATATKPMLNDANGFAVTLDRCKVVLDPADPDPNAIQVFTSARIISPDVVCSNPVKVILNAPPRGGIIELHSATTGIWSNGVQRSTVYFNDYSGTGWPSYVRVF